MLQDTIYLQEVLNTMKTLDDNGKAVPFAISFRTFQKFSSSGGKLVSYPVAKMVLKEENQNVNSIRSLRTAPKTVKPRKNPDHFTNKTRNICLLYTSPSPRDS